MLKLLREWLGFSGSVIGLETEDIPVASSAYFATPLSFSRRGIPAGQEKFLVSCQSF
jgi:hypothetical protein